MMRRSFVLALAAGFLASFLGAMEARATTVVTLESLLAPGASIEVVGNGFDLVFSNFTYSTTGVGMPTAALVNVNYPQFFTGVAGIRFTGNFGSNPGDSSDATIGYMVTSKGLGITDNHLGGNPTVIGGDGSMAVTERVTDLAGMALGQKDIFTTVINGVSSSRLNDAVTFAPHQSILVTKDIAARSFGSTPGVPTLSVIDQTFSIAVPEPTSMALLGIGMAGFFSLRRFFRRTSIA